MTGAEFRTMKLNRLLLAVMMFACVTDTSLAVDTVTKQTKVTIYASFTQPSCNINVPKSYNLGLLTPGVKTHAPLDITWECVGASELNTALIATSAADSLESSGEAVQLMVNNKPNGTILWLKEKDTDRVINLTGGSANSFCSNVWRDGETSSCTLIPYTEVHSNDIVGQASATLNFEVVYS